MLQNYHKPQNLMDYHMWFAKDYLAIHYVLFVIIYDLDNLMIDIMALSQSPYSL